MQRLPSISLVGHPFAPIGMGENVRCAHRAWRAAHVPAKIVDVYQLKKVDAGLSGEFEPHISRRLTAEVQIFHVNGDEVAHVISVLRPRTDNRGLRIICPAWELSRYPHVWAEQLDQFDEVWAQSRFTFESLAKAVKVPVVHMPEGSEVKVSSFLGRRYFAIPETSFAFLFFFNFSSYIERKNPEAALLALEHFIKRRAGAAVTFVMKVSGVPARPEIRAAFDERLAAIKDRVILIDREMTDNETKNLIRCCDSFVSLHRSEGFGHGLSEAMILGKPVIGTAYSGNMDFMTSDNAMLVDHTLIAVPKDAYPHWENQVWADPDVEQASRFMEALYDDPELCRRLGAQASRTIRRDFSYVATGVRYRARVEELSRHRDGVRVPA
jgi:glycosyltransferase involved in cell wall biosynthesis